MGGGRPRRPSRPGRVTPASTPGATPGESSLSENDPPRNYDDISWGAIAARRPRRPRTRDDATPDRKAPTMATREQIEANRRNARRSTGPKDTSRTRFNGLRHGLCAAHLRRPGEDTAEVQAALDGWNDDGQPPTHTSARPVLVRLAAAATYPPPSLPPPAPRPLPPHPSPRPPSPPARRFEHAPPPPLRPALARPPPLGADPPTRPPLTTSPPLLLRPPRPPPRVPSPSAASPPPAQAPARGGGDGGGPAPRAPLRSSPPHAPPSAPRAMSGPPPHSRCHRYEMTTAASPARTHGRDPPPPPPPAAPSEPRPGRLRRKNRAQNPVYQSLAPNWLRSGRRPRPGTGRRRPAGAAGVSRPPNRGRSGAGNGLESTMRFVGLDGRGAGPGGSPPAVRAGCHRRHPSPVGPPWEDGDETAPPTGSFGLARSGAIE